MTFPMPPRCINASGGQESGILPVDDSPEDRNNCLAFREYLHKKSQVDTVLLLAAGP